jgi:hypothetical protein
LVVPLVSVSLAFASGVPLTIVPMEVTTQVYLTPENRAEIRSWGTPLAQTLVAMMEEMFPGMDSLNAEAGLGEDFYQGRTFMHDPLAVAFTILHIEWMVQRHYVDGIKDDRDLDPLFQSLLKHHWMEEVQHAKLDTLMIEAMAKPYSQTGIDAAVEEYLEIGGFIDAGLKQQVQFDLDAFTRATGRKLSEEETDEFLRVQLQANRWTYLGSAMTHERVLETLGSLSVAARKRIEEVAPTFC